MYAQEIVKLVEAQARIADVIDALRVDEIDPDVSSSDLWMGVARGEIGVKEIRGDEHNERVLEYLRTTTLGRWGASRDETAWCSAFVNWVMIQAGLEGTNSAMARSWLGWGVSIDIPRTGCVVVFERGAAPAGHVSLFNEYAADGVDLMCLGGNQRNAVRVSEYGVERVLGYRWPADMAA